MAIGERIHFFRILRGMTQKYLGTIVGFPERSADVRLAQYETGTRKPIAELTATLAQTLDVSLHTLDVPDIDSYIGQCTLCLPLKIVWPVCKRSRRRGSEEISREEYDNWRYHYPKFDTTQIQAKVPSQELGDALVEAFKDQLKLEK